MISRHTILVLLFTLSGPRTPAQNDAMVLSTSKASPCVPTSIGNGLFSLTTTPTGLSPSFSFAARVYDHSPRDVPRIAALPAWNGIDVHDGNTWLSGADTTALRSYEQRLNMHDGLVTTTYDWADGNRTTHIAAESFVSRSDANLAVLTVTITPRYTGRVRINFSLQGWGPPARMDLAVREKLERDSTGKEPPQWAIWYPGHMHATGSGVVQKSRILWLQAVADGDSTGVGEALAVSLPAGLRSGDVRTTSGGEKADLEVAFDAREGHAYEFHSYVGVVPSTETRKIVDRARSVAAHALARGYNAARREHLQAWHALWQTDILLEGDPVLQKAVHAMMFYLLCSVRQGTAFSIPPMGLCTSGYYGHMFWDGDSYILPALLLTHPGLAESMVKFRSRTLDAAKRNARKNGFAGAMYPWEADDRGEETTPRFAAQNATHEIHVTGDVAFGQWQYYLATGDRRWLKESGYPVLKETADFWVSRVSFDASRDRYEIKDVVSVDEGLIGISNDTYTNAIAIKNLRLALQASAALGVTPHPQWAATAAKLYLPFDSTLQFHPTYENAPASTHGAVTALLVYPLEFPMSAQARRNDFSWGAKRFLEERGGAMMGETFYPLIAAELGDSSLFQELVPRTYLPHLRGDFLVLAETPDNDATNFLTGAGGFLQQVIFGYSGLRLEIEGLVQKFSPLLPHGVRRMTLKNFIVRGKKVTIIVEPTGVRRISS